MQQPCLRGVGWDGDVGVVRTLALLNFEMSASG